MSQVILTLQHVTFNKEERGKMMKSQQQRLLLHYFMAHAISLNGASYRVVCLRCYNKWFLPLLVQVKLLLLLLAVSLLQRQDWTTINVPLADEQGRTRLLHRAMMSGTRSSKQYIAIAARRQQTNAACSQTFGMPDIILAITPC